MNTYIKEIKQDAYIKHGMLEIGLCDRCEGKGERYEQEDDGCLVWFDKCKKCKGTGTRKIVK